MIRRPPISTHTYPLFPYTARFRSEFGGQRAVEVVDAGLARGINGIARRRAGAFGAGDVDDRAATPALDHHRTRRLRRGKVADEELGRAHVCTPVTNAPHV